MVSSSTLYSSSYIDSNGKNPFGGDNIKKVVFYDASLETWDRTGGSTASWYLENYLPNDNFISSMDSSKWVVENTTESYSIVFNNKATFTINDSSGSVYLSSKNLWELHGDFDISLGITVADYYDEYRSSVSFGLNVSINDIYNIRIARVRNYSSTSAKYQALYTYKADPKYFGWTALSSESSISFAEYFRLVRVGSIISAYIGSTLIGSVSGEEWSQDAYVKIGSESPQTNKFVMSASYFNIFSGSLAVPTSFDSELRGVSQPFPQKTLISIDNYGMSILDQSDMTLWCRFLSGSNNAFIDTDSEISAINGRIYCAGSSGLYIFDFVSDKVCKYAGSSLYMSSGGISSRNAYVTYNSSEYVPPLMSDSVTGVVAKNILGHEYISIATTSGINVIVDRYLSNNNSQGNPPATTIHISDNNTLYWANYDSSTNRGDLSYYNNIQSLASSSGIVFNRTGYFDSTTSPYCLKSEHIYSISSVQTGSVDQIAVGTAGGVEMLYFPPASPALVSSYGLIERTNPISDPSFSLNIGHSLWTPISSSSFPVASFITSTSWYTDGTKSLRIRPGNGGASTIYEDDWSGVYQDISLTGVDRIYFDVRLVGVSSDHNTLDNFSYEVVIDSTVISSYPEVYKYLTVTKLSEYIDVSSYSGTHRFVIRARAEKDSPSELERYAYFDNFRVYTNDATYKILGGSSPDVNEVFLSYDEDNKKIVYSTADGYGSIDLVDNTADFFEDMSNISGAVVINSAEFVSYDEI